MKGIGIDIEPGNHTLSLSAYEVSMKVIHLLRHSQQVQREDGGAFHFWRIKEHLQSQFAQIPYWSDDRWKVCLAAGGGSKRRYQYCSDIPGTILYFRALQGHSGRNLIDPLLQDNVKIQSGFFHLFYHIGCVFNLHSIINNGLIPGGQNSSKRQTVFFLPIDPRDKEHKDPEKIDLNVPRRAQYLHKTWKRHQDTENWVDINLAIRKGLTFYQTRSNAIILQGKLPAYCIPKVVRLKTGEVLYEKAYMSPRPPPKISLRHDWTKELSSKVDRQPEGEVARQPEGEVARQPEGEVARQAKFFQPTQPIPNPIRDRSGQPGITQDVIVVQDKEKRPVLKRSVWILLTKNSVLQIDQGNLMTHTTCSVFKHVLLKTTRVSMLSRLMINQGNLINTPLQYKTTLKYIMRPERSTPTIRQFVKELRKTWISKFQDYHIQL